MRLGACLAFNGMYRKFREDIQLVCGLKALVTVYVIRRW